MNPYQFLATQGYRPVPEGQEPDERSSASRCGWIVLSADVRKHRWGLKVTKKEWAGYMDGQRQFQTGSLAFVHVLRGQPILTWDYLDRLYVLKQKAKWAGWRFPHTKLGWSVPIRALGENGLCLACVPVQAGDQVRTLSIGVEDVCPCGHAFAHRWRGLLRLPPYLRGKREPDTAAMPVDSQPII